MFLDKVKIRVSSGRGGNGTVAWHREKYVDKGGPAGGDGGAGGDVYIVGSDDMSTLLDFKYKSIFKAQDGENGRPKTQHGKCGKDLPRFRAEQSCGHRDALKAVFYLKR